MVEMCDYGPVVITKGKHKGKMGYYDDEDERHAYVYLGTPFQSSLVAVRFSSMRHMSELEFKCFNELCDNYFGEEMDTEKVIAENLDKNRKYVYDLLKLL